MILLTNDDGIDAPGLLALTQAVLPASCIVVAPMQPMSECSHCVTTRKPLLIERRDTDTVRRFAVDGTPADCVRVALLHLLPEIGVDIEAVRVYSGINAGGNLGADIYISGTVAAAREAAFFGLPGIAFSQYRRGDPGDAHWQRAARLARRTIAHLEQHPLAPGEFWNVNFPWPGRLPETGVPPQPGEVSLSLPPETDPPITLCERSRRPLPVKYESIEGALHYVAGRYHGRQYEKHSDIDHCFTGHISVSRIAI